MCKQTKLQWLFTLCIVFSTIEISKAVEPEDEPIIDMDSPVVATVGEVDFRECEVSAQDRERKVQCAWFQLQENPQAEDGKTIDLFVVRLPAKRNIDEIADPMLFLAGGPGQAASESFLFADHSWSALAKKRDFYLIDQRGTGHSNYMSCDEILSPDEFVDQDYSPEKIKRLTRECLDAMPGDMRFYTTDISVQDFEKVRMALGVPKWNLLGGSYGTRVATHYMRRFPESVRTVVLDSVVPPQYVLGPEIPAKSQEVLEVLFRRCEQDSACHERMPKLQKDVNALFDLLEQGPINVKVENFRTAEIEDLVFTREHLIILIRIYLYNPHTLALLPPMLHEAAHNRNYSPLARASNNITTNLQMSISMGLQNSVMCTEEYPFYERISEAQRQANRESYMGMQMIHMMEDICSIWPRGELPENMKAPLNSSIPTLLVSGEYDPITPPEYAEETMQHLENAKHFILKGQGHFVSATGCMPHLIEKFVSDASVVWFDDSCLERISVPPLYLNFNGTAP